MAPKNPPSDEARARIVHVAELAALSLDEEEASRLAADIDAIVAYVAELDAVDTKDVPPTSSVLLGPSALRADDDVPSLSHDVALRGAPRTAGEAGREGFAVPVFVEI